MFHRIGQISKAGSQEASGCTCGYPMCIPSVDVVVTPRLKVEPGYMTVDRHYDCIVCGPWVDRRLVPVVGGVRRGKVLRIGFLGN